MREANPRGTYLLIAEALRQEIDAGTIAGSLPSEADLVASRGVSRNTIRRALKVLEAQGIVQSDPGIGWRVARGEGRRTLVERMIGVFAEDALVIGDAFPSETKLCGRFGASRTAVRRALAQMEGNGLLDTAHGKGRTVRALPASPEQP